MELGENLKEHFSKTTFYGLHAGNSQNSIWKPHSNFAFPEPYLGKFEFLRATSFKNKNLYIDYVPTSKMNVFNYF